MELKCDNLQANKLVPLPIKRLEGQLVVKQGGKVQRDMTLIKEKIYPPKNSRPAHSFDLISLSIRFAKFILRR